MMVEVLLNHLLIYTNQDDLQEDQEQLQQSTE